MKNNFASLRIAVIGTGYVGLVSGACFAALGHDVTCVDTDTTKIDSLKRGEIPIYEPGLDALVAKACTEGRLSFTNDIAKTSPWPSLVFLAVGTPSNPENGSADLSALFSALNSVVTHSDDGTIIVTKSTVPIGTGAKLDAYVKEHFPGRVIYLASNPEFLREGSAVDDFMQPDRIVIGSNAAAAEDVLRALYQPLTERGVPLISTNLETAECIKYAANSFLAVKLAYINELADLCERTQANVSVVAEAIGADPRIGRSYLKVGPGYGGYCLPKDTLALAYTAQENDIKLQIVEAAIAANKTRKEVMLKKILSALEAPYAGKTVALLGLSFKAGTDDLREAISLFLIPNLQKHGVNLRLFDPIITEKMLARALPGNQLPVSDNVEKCLDGADLGVILIEWPDFNSLPWERYKLQMNSANVLDLRNVVSAKMLREKGFLYEGIGGAEKGFYPY